MFDVPDHSLYPESHDKDLKETLSTWDSALRRFEHNIFPMFKKYGFTLPEAFLVFKINEMQNQLDVEDEKKDDDEPWKT